MMRNPLVAGALLIGFGFQTDSAEAACGDISIAEMNWGSAAVVAHIDKIVLERGFGCKVSLVPGDTVPTFTSMVAEGQPDMAPEFWINAVRGQLAKATADGSLVLGAEVLEDGAVEGWWVPKFVIDANPTIRTVDDALARPDLFPSPKDPQRGALYGCPEDWACRATTANLFKAFGAEEKNFELVEPPTGAELDASIANAFETQTGWLGYYWAPTAILGKYPMVKLSFGVGYNKAEWDDCTAIANCPSPQRNTYPTSQAYTLVTQAFTEKAEDAMSYIRSRRWSNAMINGILAWQLENKASNAETAEYFLDSHREVWAKWMLPMIAQRIRPQP